MTPLAIRIASGGVVRHTSPETFIEYHGPDADTGLAAVLQSVEEFASHRENLPALCACLERFAPELMAVATVLTLNRLPKMEDEDALPLLTKMREIGQPEWARTIAGNYAAMLEHHAVCDASEVAP